jgi:hypothetical protein
MGIDSGYGVGSLKTGVCTSTTRPAVPFDGQTISETDTDSLQVYKGTAWAPVSGLQYISGGTVTSSTSANFDSVFSATYDNYRIIISDITSSGSEVSVLMRLRVGGVTNTAANYNTQQARIYSTGTSANGGITNNADGFYLWASATSPANSSGACIIDITQPFLAKPTTTLSTAHVWDNAISAYMWNSCGGSHTVSSSFDGFTIYQTTTTTAYKYKIYGYANS